jgi:hypothetical protein
MSLQWLGGTRCEYKLFMYKQAFMILQKVIIGGPQVSLCCNGVTRIHEQVDKVNKLDSANTECCNKSEDIFHVESVFNMRFCRHLNKLSNSQI